MPHDTNSQPYPLEAVRLPHCAGAHFLNGGVHVYADQYDPATAVVGIVDYAYRDSFSGGGDDLNVSLLKPGEGLAIPFALSRGEHWAQIYAGPPPRYGASFPFEADGQAWTAIYPVYGVNNVIPPLNSSADGYTVRESHWVTTHENVPVYLEGRTPCM